MTNHKNTRFAAALALPLIISPLTAQGAGAAPAKSHPQGAAAVDTVRQLAADTEPGTWMSAVA